jgi:rhamnose transport system substrate-binding protein
MKTHISRILALLIIISMLMAACAPAAEPTEEPAPPTEAPAAEPTEAPAVEPGAGPVDATPGETVNMVLLPKFLGILVFDQANDGAMEAHAELQNAGELQFLGPTPENSVAGQIEIVTTAATQGQDAIMISNNAGDQIAPAAQEARNAGMTVVTWDSPIPSAEGEQVFVAQVDFDETGTVMADMALSILGDDGGKFAVLSASPDAANQNAWIAALEEVLETNDKYASLELLDIVYGNDQSEDSYNQALALVDKYPDMELIMAPTTVGIAAAAKAMQDEGLCDAVKVSGLGLPAEMVSYTLNGCAPEFALWSFVDLGYLTYYVSYLLATGAIEGVEGESFNAGRMGTYSIEKDPTRDAGLRVLMGPFKVYDASNVEAEAGPQAAAGEGPVKAEAGQEVNMVLLPKFLGILVFDQANDGAMEAHSELGNVGELQFLGPTPENSVAGQIEIVTTAATQGQDAIMISNNAGDQIAPAAQAARDAGLTVVTWDSPIPSAEGEQVFVAQVDFDETGTVMADMALSIMGDDGGKFAVLSASPDAANQNAWIAALEEVLETNDKYASLELLDIVYGNDQSEDSYNQALALVDKYPDMELIMAPTTVGIAAAAKAMQDEGLCDTVKVSGLGLPAEMVSYTLNGCAPEFALWSFVDLGYLTYYVSYLLATGAIEGSVGERFEAGRMGTYTIEKDPTRDAGLRVLMGPFKVYDASNVEAEAGPQAETGGAPVVAEKGLDLNMVLLPKFLGILVFDQANNGAQEANDELENTGELQFLGPTPENSVAGQIEIVTTAATQGQDAIMISNNAGDQIAPAAQAARDAGVTVVTWDSPIPSAEGEQVFVAQVDFDETGTVMADMALSILGDDGGKFAVLSASPDAANQNAWIAALEEVLETDDTYASLELLDIVYGNDQSEDSYNQALALVDKYPDMELIMAPTTVGIAAAAKAMQDEGLCDTVKVSGLGLPAEMVSYTLNDCAPEFALWSFVDLGYLSYYVSYLLASGAIEGSVGERFEAGRMGTYTIEKDPTRDVGLRVLMGPFTVYNKDNVEEAAE